jgi:hypothetical protein
MSFNTLRKKIKILCSIAAASKKKKNFFDFLTPPPPKKKKFFLNFPSPPPPQKKKIFLESSPPPQKKKNLFVHRRRGQALKKYSNYIRAINLIQENNKNLMEKGNKLNFNEILSLVGFKKEIQPFS